MGGLLTVLKEHERYLERGHVGLPAHIVPAIMANASSASVAIEIGAHAGALATATACASGADAIAQALQLFRDDEIDVAVVGGTEAVIHPVTLSSFAALRALSARHDDPAAASRPFDRDRDGFVLGEGAGVLVVESRRHAAARAAHVWGRLLSAARTCDASHIVVPEPTGRWSAEAMSRALRRAGVGASDVTFVSAHATATPHGDLAEFKALQTALGSSLPGVCVTAVKSALGHLIGASGAVATALAIMSLHDGAVPPTLNVDHLDPQIELNVVRNSPRVLSGSGTALINSFGFGGHNVAVVAAAA